MLKPTETAARLLGAAVRGLHGAGAATRDDRKARLHREPAELHRARVHRVALGCAGRAEDGDRAAADRLDRREAGPELVGDHLDVALDLRVDALEDASVRARVHRRSCATCAPNMPSARSPVVTRHMPAST